MSTTRGESRILALDVGKVRVGVAISDPMGLTAQPGPTLSRNPAIEFHKNLAKCIEEYRVGTIVLGLPLGLKGQKGESYRDVQVLLEEIRERHPSLLFETCDERFTSSMAQQASREAPRKRKRQKGLVDRIAAQLILQTYLDSERRKRGDAEIHG